MIKIKHIFYFALISVLLCSCGSDSSSNVDNFDHEAQAVIDNDSLVTFLKNNYYNSILDSVKVIDNNQKSLWEEREGNNVGNVVNLYIKEVKEGNIDYKLYYYRYNDVANNDDNIGSDPKGKGFPTVMDSVYAKYRGQRIIKKDSLSPDFDNKTTWFSLSKVIRGWAYSFVNFKGGKNIINDGPITYINGGKGVLFIPSGLGYRNGGRGTILPNENLLFYIELWDIVENTDDDQDGVPSIKEDLENGDGTGDGDPRNDDTDGDRIANYLDTDDDGDGKLTKDEDANGDGDPRNDFNDPNNPTLPDYLNRDIR